MDRFLVRKDVYNEIEKAVRDRSHLTQKKITDKNGKQRTVWVRGTVEEKKQRQKKGEELTGNKFKVGDSVTLDGVKGDYKVNSIDEDGAYHVVSADGKKGYKVSENHITGNKGNPEDKKEVDSETKKEQRPKKEISVQVKMKRKEQQKKEKEKYDYNKRMNDFYVNTGLNGGPDAVLYRQAVEKEENKQPNLRAGSRDDSIFEQNDDVQFWRNGNYIDGKITQVRESYDGSVSLQVESNGNKYWVETENIIKHPASAE